MLSSPPSAFALLRPPRNLASQFELTTRVASPDHPTVVDLLRAAWRNKRYVSEESLSRKGSKGRKSWIKRHGIFLVEIDTNDSPLSPYWTYRLCDVKGQPEFFAAAATSSAADHLRKSHRIFESSQAADPDLSTDKSERPKRRRLQYSAMPRARVKIIQELGLGFLINTNVPFSFFSDMFFQQLTWQLDPHLSGRISCSRQSMGRLLDDMYKTKKDRVKQELLDALSKIHLGCLLNFYGDLDAETSLMDFRARRMRCYGDILNLVARAFLYGEEFEAFEAESQRCELFKRISRENYEAQEYLLASESTAELEVVMSNDKRWNSTYDLSRLVKQGDIRAFLAHPEVEKWLPEADMLKGDDWRLLTEIKHILEPFYLQTMRTQDWGGEGGNGRLWEVMTSMEYLLEHLEDRKLFHHIFPEEVVGENTDSQAETARRRPDRNWQLPARLRDCEMDMHPRKSMQSSLPGRGSGQYDDGPGKPSGSSAVDDMGKDH
ncbi:hypothetical protein FBEOM_9456 [Fusarium beomiforme]|uniref:Uncharacterized protein n=1 Tax=Fusarium beomiforme TaxID=44412 RepID=A0A9P5AEV5_9HYPO|nr:hypothetical protein FBEOM_9456 [Fusarium beomiforme]